MVRNAKCPVCGPAYGGEITPPQNYGGWLSFICDVCGPIGLLQMADIDIYQAQSDYVLRSAALSHLLSNADREQSNKFYLLNQDNLDAAFAKLVLPTPIQQGINLIRLIGAHVEHHGVPLRQTYALCSKIGAPSEDRLQMLVNQLVKKGLMITSDPVRVPDSRGGGEVFFPSYDLTLDGWEKYEAERRGKLSSKFGFVAMQFNEPQLIAFLNSVKDAVLRDSGYELKDVTQFSKAGIIDNIIREQIRDCAFVIADLTHNNRGAYWEAGYAEGLGKPVIYICRGDIFDDEGTKPHFDTNHCTTVKWQEGQSESFVAELVATIRRSLNIFTT